MSEHVSAAMIDRYQRQLMSPAALLSIDGHLSSCESCCKKLYVPEQLQDAFASLRVNLRSAATEKLEHPASEQFSAYVDGTLDDIDREIMQGHLEVCSPCTLELRELLAFKAELANQQDSAAAISPPERGPNRWQRFVAFMHLPSSLTPLHAASAAAAVLLFVGTGILVWLGREANPNAPTEIAQTNTTPDIAGPTPVPTQATPTPISTEQGNTNQTTTSGTPPIQTPTPRQIVTPPTSAQVVVALNDGGNRITVDDGGNVAGVETLPTAYQRAVRDALATGRVSRSPALSSVGGQAGVLMGGSDTGVPFAILSPVGKVIRTDRPEFRWSPLEGASGYTVNVYDSNYKKVAGSPELQTTQWIMPQPLAPGGIYRWEVAATKNGEQIMSPQAPAPEAKFKVLEKSKADELDEAQRRFPRTHLMLGLLYAREGLIDDAEREFQALVDANPDSPLARKLLKDLQAQREKR